MIALVHSSVILQSNFSKAKPVCHNLLSQQRIVFVLLPMLISSFILNMVCLTIKIKIASNKNIHHIFVILIHLCGTLMSTYNALFWYILNHYKGKQIAIEDEWKKKPLCLCMSCINSYSTHLTCVLMGLLAHSRFFLVKYPIDSKLRRMALLKIGMLSCISVAAIIILLQVMYSVSNWNYSSNTFCLFLPYQDQGNSLLMYSLHVRLILHILCLMFMSIMAHLTLLELNSSLKIKGEA